ncbi:MAG: hypothetical protein PUE01_07290 [Clostridiaceae bacterium]|nr:hypothetical protein [Clostridiaceae bacterium]
MKLPGSRKFKIILLSILVVISISIIILEIINYKKSEDDITHKSETMIQVDQNSDEDVVADKDVNKEEELVSQEEETLYDDAYVQFTAGKYNDAIIKANAIIEKYPNSYKAFTIRGFAKAFNTSFDGAMEDIDKALSIKDDYWYARYAKAFTYELYDKFDDALIWYDKSLEANEYMWTYYGKASIYGRRADVQNTVFYLKKAIEVEGVTKDQSGIIKEARTEKDFDPVRGQQAFEHLIK